MQENHGISLFNEILGYTINIDSPDQNRTYPNKRPSFPH
jgi:hypothetical protein